MRRYHETFRLWEYLLFAVVTLAVLCLCVCIGSVRVPLGDTLAFFAAKLTGGALPEGLVSSIMPIRLPRVLCVALTGAALSLAGAAMQGLLKNPLADGSTLGVSSGASLGAVCAIAFGVTLPGFPFAGTMVMAILFAFGSLLVILGLSYKLDRSLSTNTIILIGVIFSMFVSSIMSIVITFAADKVQKITFWTMGSLSGSTYQNAAVLALALAVCGAVILLHAQILNAFAVGEDNARQIGVDVKRAKLVLLITVSVLIGVCVSIGGTIGFVGLVTPHMARMLVGPNHRRLLPAAMFGGAVFLMLADLVARTLLNPLELPIGVVTSFVKGALSMPMLEVSRLSVQFGQKKIVDGLSFTVEEGQWLMIVGPNGAGKSTALNAVTQGAPYTGRVLFAGQDVAKMKPALRAQAIGVLAQNHFVGYGFTVEEVVRLGRFAYAGGLFGRSQTEDREKVEQALALAGLQDKRRQSVLTLSGGELQRTFLAQVLAQDPKLLLLDEPTNHLDLIYQKQIFALIGSWLHEPGRAVVSVVHDLSLARSFGTDALLMDHGRQIAHGPAAQVLTPERLNAVYGMDVPAWMRSLYAQWAEDNEKAPLPGELARRSRD